MAKARTSLTMAAATVLVVGATALAGCASDNTAPATRPPGVPPSFVADVLPLFERECNACHGNLGGWDGTSYEEVMNSGDHGPTVIPGDPEGSLLAQKLLGTHREGLIMPPAGKLADHQIQMVLDWIEAGAPER